MRRIKLVAKIMPNHTMETQCILAQGIWYLFGVDLSGDRKQLEGCRTRESSLQGVL